LGKTIDFWCYGTVIYALSVIVVNLKIAMYTNTHTIISTVFLILSVLTYFITVIIFSHIIIFTITNNDSNIFLDPKYFFTMLETIVLIEMFEYVLRKSLIFFGIVEEGEKLKPYKENINFYLNENLTNINKTSSFNSIDLESENELKSINNEIINNNSK
jgi:ABC-type multidrug transport system fused ATPase/permease subunit